MNQWVENYLHAFVIGCQNDWSKLLPMAEFVHNSWEHEQTKHTPHELIIRINPTASITTPEDKVPAAQKCLRKLQKSRTDAQKALQRRIKPLTPPCTFVTGNKVWLDACNLHIRTPFRKLSPLRYGPFKVLEQISPVMYHFDLPYTMKIYNVFHVDLLTPYHETNAYGEAYSQPPSELIDGQQEYEVKEIIDDQSYRRKQQYLVRWLGYPASKNSWVDAKDLHSLELLAEYHLFKA
jgi:hypothetical protein